jgi:S1-C subfamily serine protease
VAHLWDNQASRLLADPGTVLAGHGIMIEFTCPSCGRRLKVLDELAGKTGKCPQCRQSIKLPGPSASTAASPVAVVPAPVQPQEPDLSRPEVVPDTLAQRLQEERLRFDEAANLLEQLASLVERDRARGVFHPNLTPADVLLTPSPGEGQRTAKWVVGISERGTRPAASSPSQAGGMARKSSPAADVYFLGTILYECLTGQSFTAAVKRGDPPPPKKVRPTCPRELDIICRQCVQKNPKKRYQSAQALADDLRRFQDGEPLLARRHGWLGRHKVLASLLALIIVAGASVGGYLAFFGTHSEQSPASSLSAGTVGDLAGAARARGEAEVPPPGPLEVKPAPPAGPGPIEPVEVAADTTRAAAKGPTQEDPPPKGSKIPDEALSKAKRATVLVKVTTADGTEASGSGFFGVADAHHLILTNAHVVGMLSQGSQPPKKVEVVLNSGQVDERLIPSVVLGVDRSADLAILSVGAGAAGLPEPLKVRAAAGLHELTELYTLGFPLGERLGKEITVRPTSVSALRHNKAGMLARVQVNGGMDPGNSGGPVVDAAGHVIGVAVAVIEGRLINFAIPGEQVHAILNGRLAEMDLRQPFKVGDRLAVPVVLTLIDPRKQIGEVALDLWTGDKAPGDRTTRPGSETRPGPEKGDSPRLRCKLPYNLSTGQAAAEVLLPKLPAGNVYWVQASWTHAAGSRHWGKAEVFRPTAPVERTPVRLALSTVPEQTQHVDLKATNSLRFASEDDEDEGPLPQRHIRAKLLETLTAANEQQRSIRLKYLDGSAETVINKKAQPNELPDDLKQILKTVTIKLTADGFGRPTGSEHDDAMLAGIPPVLLDARRRQAGQLIQPVERALTLLSVPLPGQEVQARQSWTHVQQAVIHDLSEEIPVMLELTYTYLGQRTSKDSKEAVLGLDGVVKSLVGRGSQVGGTAVGTAVVDVAAGRVSRCDLRLNAESEQMVMAPDGNFRELRLINTHVLHLQRGP